jgi:hypothetical protein
MTCELRWDAGDLFAALDDDRDHALAHVATCDACKTNAELRARAKAAWTSAMRRDDVEERAASEAKLAGAWPRRPSRARPLAFALAAATIGLVAGVTIDRVASSPAPLTATSAAAPGAPGPASRNGSGPNFGPERIGEAPPAAVAEVARGRAQIVAVSPCEACVAGVEAVKPGMKVDGALVVPAGAHLTLGFAFDDGSVDPKSGADVDGPAVAKVEDASTFTLVRGVARVRGAGSKVTVHAAGTALETKDAVYTLSVDEHGATHVAVERGTVTVTRGGAPVIVLAGRTLDLAPEPAPAASSAPSTAAAPAPPVASASASPLAPTDVAARPAAAPAPAVDPRRASFKEAELELARGDAASARPRLESLLTGNDSLAADAATLLARSYVEADGRASAWQRYLATSPRSPYRERALLERADALLDAHRVSEAQQLLTQLRSSTLTESQRQQLDRLAFKAKL